MNPSYLLNFVIPQGPTGPQGATGPTGPTSALAAYGGRYNTTSSNINLGIGTQSQVPLATTMPNSNVTYPSTNSLTLGQAGVYEINYYMLVSATVATTITMAVRSNGTNIPSTVTSRPLSVGTNSVFSGSTIVTLPTNSVIDMAISALVALGVTLGSGVSASLTIKKIGSNT